MKSLNFPYNPKIDQLRWLAATIVFLFHFHLEYPAVGGVPIGTSLLGIVTEGHTGVGLFFTLSGFLFMQIGLHQKGIVYRDFIRNRFLRIFPLFFTIFLLATSIGRDTFLPQDIFYLLSSNLGLAPTSNTVITGAAWCISLEFLFYMLFPFLCRFAMELGVRYLLKLLGLMLFFKLAAYTVNDRSTLMYFSTFVGRFDQFLIGMLAAILYQRHGEQLRRYARWLLPLACGVVILNSAMQAHFASFAVTPRSVFWIGWSMLESSGWACFILAWLSFDKALPAWLERTLCHGGKVSFSFYLLHMAVIHLLARWYGAVSFTSNGWGDAAIWLVGVYATAWGLATLSYSTIEEPFLRMRRGYGGGGVLAVEQRNAPVAGECPKPEETGAAIDQV
jgi:peptidoglycan/LPS O-acetylase OafA/YrhL